MPEHVMRLETIQAGAGGIRGLAARFGLQVLTVPYWLAGRLRALAYAVGLRKTRRLPVPVLSIGNLAVGGTGKTPFTAWWAAALRQRGYHPGILSRGYGPPAAAASGLSDEGAVLRHVLGPDVPIHEQPDRWRGGQALLARHPEVDVLLLDDGFQQKRLTRDLDLVLLDATNPFGYGHLLPRGRLRESPRALCRADVVAITRAERRESDILGTVRGQVASWCNAPVLQVSTVPLSLEVAGETRAPETLQGSKVFAVCGLGNPDAFVAFLGDLGAKVVGSRLLGDHAALSKADLDDVRRAAGDAGAKCVVMTRKDAVKLGDLPPDVAVLDVTIEVTHGEDSLWHAVDRVLGATTPPPVV